MNNKKTYIKPNSTCICLDCASLICESLDVHDDEAVFAGSKDRSEIEDVDFDQLLDIW